jgi:prepilin-type N-terminal cleavage/methylation domain-containing protein
VTLRRQSEWIGEGKAGPARPRRRGMSLIELMVVVTLTGVLAAFAVPSYRRGVEQSRVDQAAGTLRTVWAAQRLYKLDNPSYAADLHTLANTGFIDSSLSGLQTPYSYLITAASSSGFTVVAQRSGSAVWSGTLSLDESGVITGSIVSSTDAVNPSVLMTE